MIASARSSLRVMRHASPRIPIFLLPTNHCSVGQHDERRHVKERQVPSHPFERRAGGGKGEARGPSRPFFLPARFGQADAGEATGLLTHHLAHEDRCWGFIETFVKKTVAHPATSWRTAAELFPEPA